jgi:hypothetical protein
MPEPEEVPQGVTARKAGGWQRCEACQEWGKVGSEVPSQMLAEMYDPAETELHAGMGEIEEPLSSMVHVECGLAKGMEVA